MKRLIALFCLICMCSSVDAQQIRVYLSNDSLAAGERFEYRVRTDFGSTYDYVLPPDSASWGELVEFKSMKRVETPTGRDSLVITLQFFGTKDTLITPKTFRLIGPDTLSISSPTIPIFFKSRVPTSETELQPLKPIYAFARNWLPWILLFFVVMGIAYYVYHRIKKRPGIPVNTPIVVPMSPFVSPLDVLNTKLEALKRKDLVKAGDYKSFYTELGDILRRYIEDAHEIPALESTTGELRRSFKQRGLHSELAHPLIYILEEADMVKFAKFAPSESAANACFKHARTFSEAAQKLDYFRIQVLRDTYERQHGPA